MQPHPLSFLMGLTRQKKKKSGLPPPKPLPPRPRRLTLGEAPSTEEVQHLREIQNTSYLSHLANLLNLTRPEQPTKAERPNESLPPPIADTQESSLLFRLPIEIRLKIYTLVVGNRNIHLRLETQDEDRFSPYLRHYYCKYGQQDLFTEPWHDCWYPRGGRPKDPVQHILSLFLTCRLVYSESIDLLYSTNTFQIENLHLFKHLHTLILPQRLQAMKRLVLILEFAQFPLSANEMETNGQSQAMVCKRLSEMTGLREVHLHLQAKNVYELMWRDESSYREAFRAQIEPLVEQLDNFKVWLPVMKSMTWEGMERDCFAVWPAQDSYE